MKKCFYQPHRDFYLFYFVFLAGVVGSEPSPPQKKHMDLLSLSGKGSNILLVIKHNKGAAKNNVTLTINNSIQK